MSRVLLTADTKFFVNPLGSNSNPGTSDSPWKTLQFACDVVRGGIDCGGFTAEIYIADGAYDPISVFGATVGASGFQIYGNAANPENVVILSATDAPCVMARDFGIVTLHDLSTLRYTNGVGFSAQQFAVIDLDNIVHGNVGGLGKHMAASEGGRINLTGPQTITGDAYYHGEADGAGSSISLGGQPTYIPASRNFASAFFSATRQGQILGNGAEAYTGPGAGPGSTGYTAQAGSFGQIFLAGVTPPGQSGRRLADADGRIY
jgi:hypothetical protein